MRIIAKMSGSSYMIEAGEQDIAALHGFTSTHDSGYCSSEFAAIGHTIDIKGAVKLSTFVKTMDVKVLENIRERLVSTQKQVDELTSLVEKLNLFEVLSSEKA